MDSVKHALHAILSGIFGDRAASGLTIAERVLTAAGAVYVAKQAAEYLGLPVVRWILCGSIVLLCFAAISSRAARSSVLVKDDGTHLTVTKPRTAYVLVLIFFGVLLVADLWFVLRSSRRIFDVGTVTWTQTAMGFVGDPPVPTFDALVPTGGSIPIDGDRDILEGRLQFDFAIRKRDNVNELRVRDIKITVEDYKPLPANLMVYTVMSPSERASVVFIEVDKLDTPLPWVFSATYVQTGIDEPVRWDMQAFLLRDGTQRPIIVKVISKAEGVFTMRASIDLEPDLGKTVTATLDDDLHVYGFYKEEDRPVSGDPMNPSPPPPDRKAVPAPPLDKDKASN
jgi:hypothetical protein